MAAPLNGFRVIDCSRGLAGLRATGFLADYGADVIWVEPPGGDPLRERETVACAVFNRGKRSLELDLGKAEARAKLAELAASADVLVVSDDPGCELDFNVGSLRASTPSLITCSISGFGIDGPLRNVAPREALVHALVGSMGEQVGHREGPIFEALPFSSMGAAYLTCIGVLAALYRREEDGAGRHVETSLYDGALAYLSMMWGDTTSEASRLPTGRNRLVSTSFRCADDEYIGVHTGAVGAFGRLMKVLGLDDRIPSSSDGRDMGIPLTDEERNLLESRIHKIFASKPRDDWEALLRRADVCAVPHLCPGQVFDTPQARHNEMSIWIDDPTLGRVEQVAPPVKFSATPARVLASAPTPGQHSIEILDELRSLLPRPNPSGVPNTARPLLDGLRILDLGAYYAGPYSSRLLADLGADVIKLEPVPGDPLRGLGRVFRSAQAGKRSLAVNLKDPDLSEAREGLLAWADLIHHNMRPGAAERLGFGYEQVCAKRPEIVYLYAPGWGASGPDRDRQSFAPMLSGYVGVGFEVAGQFNPPLFALGNEDPGNALVGAAAMLMALLHQRRTGEGQYVENPQLNAAMAHVAHVIRLEDGEVRGTAGLDPLQRGVGPLERLYETSDGWLCIAVVEDTEIAGLGSALGTDLLADARFRTRASRARYARELESLLEDAFAKRRTSDWVNALDSAGVPAAEPLPYNAQTFLRDPENRRTGRAAESVHPRLGTVREIGCLLRVSDAATPTHRIAPDLGQHNQEILKWLGYDDARIAALRERGSAA